MSWQKWVLLVMFIPMVVGLENSDENTNRTKWIGRIVITFMAALVITA